ncbi:unnamed protein product [Peronospora destructor]|uniref:C2 domain-containing protein n=1 Tax=Peronospora destructor TaxID=86335 RepID=A0AAV0TRI9_9STRA|nr:unnamed protein product [Peronospora destructor]
MSAVDDVEARIRRLDATRAATSMQLRLLQQDTRYNSITGVDERLDSGQSVARLEVKVDTGRNLLFKAGFLSGQRTYVRVTVEVMTPQLESNTVMEQKLTTTRPVSATPRWNETVLFQGLPAALGTLRADVMQEERIGADELVGTLILPLARLQDQRKIDKWYVLEKHTKVKLSQLFLSCRFERSSLSALELELELLQNQINELHLFLGRHQNLIGLSWQDSTNSMMSSKPLQGKEVVSGETPEQTVSTRFSAVASFPPAMRKRELAEDMEVNVEMTRVKRQRVDAEKPANSLSDRIANWLLPASALATPTTASKSNPAPQNGDFSTEESLGRTSSQFFPFKQPGPLQQGHVGQEEMGDHFLQHKDGNPRDLPFGRQASSY